MLQEVDSSICLQICFGSHMKHLTSEWVGSRGVGGRETGKPDPADDSVNRSNHTDSSESALQTGGYQ